MSHSPSILVIIFNVSGNVRDDLEERLFRHEVIQSDPKRKLRGAIIETRNLVCGIPWTKRSRCLVNRASIANQYSAIVLYKHTLHMLLFFLCLSVCLSACLSVCLPFRVSIRFELRFAGTVERLLSFERLLFAICNNR